MELHKLGYYKTENGMLTNEGRTFFANDICVIVDIDVGTLLNVGDRNTSNISTKYDTMVKKYRDAGLDEYADALLFVEFNKYEQNISRDGICTLVNYLSNCIGSEKMKELFAMDNEALNRKIEQLQEIGF